MAGATLALKVDASRWEAIRRRLSEAAGSGVKVGVLAANAERGEGRASNVEIAIYNEFGTETIPERPFLRGSFLLHRQEYRDRIGKIFAAIANGADAHEQLERLGQTAAGDMKRFIVKDGSFTPDSPKTIARKGSDRPLVDTGQLKNSISYEVTDPGGDE